MPSFAVRCCVFALVLALPPRAGAACDPWPDWQRFARIYVSDDGRVIDASTAQRITTSESQAYGLIFALIGNDPAVFARLLAWTRNNLAHGVLGDALPAWKWGRAADGSWRILDDNAAADADLWLAYALVQAARLWHDEDYARLGRKLTERIERDEIAWIPGLGMTLLPAPRGFVDDGTWRLNPSYSPIEVLRALSQTGDRRLWTEVLETSRRLLLGSAPRGYAPDWTAYRGDRGFFPDPVSGNVGSYDAIRVYLWAGMLANTEPQRAALARRLAPMLAAAGKHAFPPESVDTLTGETRGTSPPGFAAALLPLLAQTRQPDAVRAYREHAAAAWLRDDRHYYSDSLSLFGLGWLDGRYRFDSSGALQVAWTTACTAR